MGIRRKSIVGSGIEDRIKVESRKFIDKLSKLEEFMPIMQEGTEEAITTGDEEVKFLKKDLRMLCSEINFMHEFIMYTIKGNIKALQKIV